MFNGKGLMFIGPGAIHGVMMALARQTYGTQHEIVNKIYDPAGIIDSYMDGFQGFVFVGDNQSEVFSKGGKEEYSSDDYTYDYLVFTGAVHYHQLKIAALLHDNSILPGNNAGLDFIVQWSKEGKNSDFRVLGQNLRDIFYR